MAIDPNWVRENPEEAARQIELLTKERDQYRAAEEKQIALREKAAQRVEELECQVEEAGRYLRDTARRDALIKADAFAEAAALCRKTEDGQNSLAWMHKEISPDGEEYIGANGISYSNKALGAQHCAADLERKEKKFRRQVEVVAK